MSNSSRYERYSRQILLPELGEAGQEKLLASKVLVIGAGGLGCPVLQYLTAAGVGTIGIADDDIVSISNLHRQILYGPDDVGKPKATTAAQKLKKLNEDVQFEVYETRITNANAWDIISKYDLVVDGSDNFSTRYLVNDACVLLGKPLVYGSIFRFEGQVAVFNQNGSANYRDLFPEPPQQGEVPDCAEAGVIGVLTGIIGSLMANEAIKLVTGIGTSLANKLLTYNSLHNTFYEIELEPNSKASSLLPKSRSEFESKDYNLTCAVDTSVAEIDFEAFNSFITLKNAIIIDVREQGEQPAIKEFEHLSKPLSELRNKLFDSVNNKTIIVFCQSGKRSKEAASLIKMNNPLCNIYSLKGGISQWKNKQLKQVKG